MYWVNKIKYHLDIVATRHTSVPAIYNFILIRCNDINSPVRPASNLKIYSLLWEGSGFPDGSDGKESTCMQENQVRSLGREGSLEKRMATHCSILAWRISWIEEPGRLQSIRLQRVRRDWSDLACRWWRAVNATALHVEDLAHFLTCNLRWGVRKVLLYGRGRFHAQADYVAMFLGGYSSSFMGSL